MARIAPEWYEILVRCQVKPTTAAIWSEILATVIRDGTFSRGEQDLRNFVGQTLYETQLLERLEENLNYSADRLTKVWPARFPTIASAQPYARNPEALANRVYGGRLGNTQPGDGWKYRGSGIPMVTGKANYALVQHATGLPVVEHPDMLRQPLTALQAGVAWWELCVPDVHLDDPANITKDVQGGAQGLPEREQLTVAASQALQTVS